MQDLDPPFHSTLDRLGISRHGMAITEKSRVLLVCGPSDAVLQAHANELLDWLRQARPRLQVQMVPALEGEQLVQRFNDMLAGLSVKSAVRPDMPTPPERLWILRDAGQLQDTEVRLLSKLQQQFPAARLSTIILTSQASRYQSLLESDDRGIQAWFLPGARPLRQEPAGPLPSPLAMPPMELAEPRTEPPLRRSAEPRARALPATPAGAAAGTSPGRASKTRPAAPTSRARKILMGALLGFVTSTTLVVGGVLWLHSQGQLGQLRAWLQPGAVAARPAAPAPAAASAPAPAAEPVAAAPSPAPEASAPTTESAAAAPAPAATAPAAPTGQAAVAAAGSATPSPTPAPAAAAANAPASPVSTVPPAPEPPAGRSTAAADARAPAALPPAVREGRRWAAKLPEENHLVVHGRFDSLSQAEQFAKRRDYLQNARMVPGTRTGASAQVWVVTGPFQSEPRAQAYISRLALKDVTVLKVADWPAR